MSERTGDGAMNYTTNVGERGVATEETARLIASDKVEGTAVFDPSGKHLGRVHHLMIDKYNVVDVDRAKLEKAPYFASNTTLDWSDRVFNDKIEQYWYPGV
jgi:myo-inositol-hexaphosphate 3-phosphohydrolase